MEREELKFLAVLLFLALAVRIIPAFLFIEEPDIPHDMAYYAEHARFFEEGRPYEQVQGNGLPVVYGPASLAVYFAWGKIGGLGFFWLKMLPIIFDLVSIAAVYFIGKKAWGIEGARASCAAFAFFYLSVLSAGAIGNDDHVFFGVLLFGIALAVNGMWLPAGIAFGIASGFKPVPIAVAPLVAYYLWRRLGIWKAIGFAAVSGAVFLAILAPFCLESGAKALVPYTGLVNFQYFSAGGIAPLNLARTIAAGGQNALYFLQNGNLMPFGINPLKAGNPGPINDFFAWISSPLFYLSFAGAFAYAYFFRMRNPEHELLRNCAVLLIASVLFAKVVSDLLFLYAMPFVFLLLWKMKMGEGDWKQLAAGAFLMFISVLLFSAVYRENPPGLLSALALLASVLLAGIGAFIALGNFSGRVYFAVFAAGCALFEMSAGSPLYLLKPALFFVADAPFGPESVHSYMIKTAAQMLSGLLVIGGAAGMLLCVHRISRQGAAEEGKIKVKGK